MVQLQEQTPYINMSVTLDLRPMLHRAGFKNINRFNRPKLAQICEEFDRVSDITVRDLPPDYRPSEDMKPARDAIIDKMLRGNGSNSTSATTQQSSNNKRKQTQPAGAQRGKRQKVSDRENNDTVGSDAEVQDDTGARHDGEPDKLSETNAQASNHCKTQTTHKNHKTRGHPLKSQPTSSGSSGSALASQVDTKKSNIAKKAAVPKRVKKSVAPKVVKRSVVPKKTKQPVASSVKPSQEPTRRSSRNKKAMNTRQLLVEESHTLQTETSEPVVPRAKDPSASAADSSSAVENLKQEVENKEPEDTSDDSELDGEEVEDNDEDDNDNSDEEQRAGRTNETSAQRTPHNLHLGTHKIVRHEVRWDPLDKRIPTSCLTWYEQVERQRAKQAQSGGQLKTTKKID